MNEVNCLLDGLKRAAAILALALIAFLPSEGAEACGFHDCPMGGPKSKAKVSEVNEGLSPQGTTWGLHSYDVSLKTSILAFAQDRNALEGWIFEEGFSVSATLHPRLSLGLSASYQWVNPDDKRWPGNSVRGFANPLVSMQVELWSSTSFALASGLQVEIPIGSKYVGVAEEHWEAFPYLSGSWFKQNWELKGSVGYRESFSNHTHGVDDEHPANAALVGIYVDPHAAKEWLTRLELGWAAESGLLGLSGYIDGMFPTLEDDLSSYGELGAALVTTLTETLSLELNIGAGIFGDDLRAPWRTGVSLGYSR